MKYERLTGQEWSENIDLTQELGYSYIYKRLHELETKIEQGTLVDTESYFIVEEHQWAGKNRFLIGKNDIQLAIYDFCETREEAEKRLKELQNG